jgi:hypothetical protein
LTAVVWCQTPLVECLTPRSVRCRPRSGGGMVLDVRVAATRVAGIVSSIDQDSPAHCQLVLGGGVLADMVPGPSDVLALLQLAHLCAVDLDQPSAEAVW